MVRALQASAPAAAARLAGVLLARHSRTCYLSYSTVADAMDAYGALLVARLRINGRKVTVAYCPEEWPTPATSNLPPTPAAVAAGYTAADIPRMAAYSAQLYATTPQEQANYLRYYTAFYNRQLTAATAIPAVGATTAGGTSSEADRVNAAAAVAQSAISQMHARSEDKLFTPPDTSTYVYDESSGYYYDASTGYYYDASTQYYYDSVNGQYLYWDAAKMSYLPATAAQQAAPAVTTNAENPTPAAPEAETTEDKKKGVEKQDKIKVAKKIAKDMERWAKTLNQKKETARSVAAAESAELSYAAASSGSADIGFTVLESRGPPAPPSAPMLVPSYGAGSDSSGDEEEGIIDWNKLACLLCKRQFPSREVLEKHQRLSNLHRQNLEELKGKKSNTSQKKEPIYRDRAAERRLKFGEDDPPPVSRGKPAHIPEPLPPPPVSGEIGEDNVGNRLLQKMGWSAGQGLGREGQGRVGPLEARAGPPGAGLGQKRGIYTAGPGETYRDCVKKLMIARYQDLVENEANS